MGEQNQHYLRDYWREAPCHAWRDTWRYFRKEIAWRILELLALVVALFGPLLWDFLTKGGAVFNSTLWPDLWHGAVLSAGVFGLGLLWNLLVLRPARVRRDTLLRVQAAEDKSAGLEIQLALRPKPEPPSPVAVESMVSSDVLNRLREICEPCHSAAAFAREYLLVFCLDWSGGPADRWEPIVARLLMESAVLAGSLRSLQMLNEKLAVKGDITASQFADLLQTFDGLLSQYARLCEDLLRAGSLFVGGETNLRSQPQYSLLYQRHLEAVAALRQVRARDDFGELAVQHIKQLRDLLPPPIVPLPPAGPPSPTASA
jgi:hypothetical protein